MTGGEMSADMRELKIEAARAALDQVEDGMRLGIGTGSTAEEFVRVLAERVAGGLTVIGVPTSERTAALCRELGVPLTTLDETPELDLTIDGADEIGPQLGLIKGGGGALLREKIVAAASRRMIVIADKSKLVETLGRFPLPIEVNSFGLGATVRTIERTARALGLEGALKVRERDGKPFVTDGGHLIVDASFGRIPDPRALANALNAIPGVVEHGLFLDLADTAFVAGDGEVRTFGAA
nr:ribose-5-phosphate isomerase RpiA [Nitratireductor rhodophyticola]